MRELGHVTEQIRAREPPFHALRACLLGESVYVETSDDFWEFDGSVMGHVSR
jgi:hypothetical protein